MMRLIKELITKTGQGYPHVALSCSSQPPPQTSKKAKHTLGYPDKVDLRYHKKTPVAGSTIRIGRAVPKVALVVLKRL